MGADNHSMQALVAVDLGNRHVVLETFRSWLVQLVDYPQSLVAVGAPGNDDPDGVDVLDILELQFLALHFAIDIEYIFLPAVDFGLKSVEFKLFSYVFAYLVNDGFPTAFGCLDAFLDGVVALGIKVLET